MPAPFGDCYVYLHRLGCSPGAEMSFKSEPMLPYLCLGPGTVGASVRQPRGSGKADGSTSVLVQNVPEGLGWTP